MRKTPTLDTIRYLLIRVARDATYRAHVIEDGRAAQVEAGLAEEDWHILLDTALAVDETLRRDPNEPTEVDHGAADGAGAKG